MRAWLALLSTALCAHGALAAPAAPGRGERPIASPVWDRFYLRGSYFTASVATDLRLDPDVGLGTPLTAEDDLGLDERIDQGRLELMFRLRERNRLRVDYFKLDRYGDQLLARQIVFGDRTFEVNDRVQSTLDWRMLGFTYTYSVLRRERFEVGAGLGIHLLEAEARGEVPARFLREETSGVGAFPTVALDAAWRVSRRFSLTARGQYFSASVDDFDGSLGDYHLDLQYRWRPNFAVGLGYTVIRAELEVTDTGSPGRVSLDTQGPELFFRVSF